MYVIESNDPYSKRMEYLSGLDQVTRKALWTRDPKQAVQFADRASAEVLAGEALLDRVATVGRLKTVTMAERFVPLYQAWDDHCTELYVRTIAGERSPDLWDFVRAREPDITALSLWDAVPREAAAQGIRRLVDVILFDDGSSAIRRYELDDYGRATAWKAVP
jgi:hypothetical protein